MLNDAELGAANPYFPVLAQALQAPPNWRPRTDQWNAVETIIGTHLNAALAGLETADEVATKASAGDPDPDEGRWVPDPVGPRGERPACDVRPARLVPGTAGAAGFSP